MPQRRDFLKITGLMSAGILSDLITPGSGLAEVPVHHTRERQGTAGFNMSGYAAPKLDTVRIGFIGLGNRGPAAVERMSFIEGAEIKALCDIRPEKANAVKKKLEGSIHRPEVYTGGENAWKRLCEQKDLDLIYIATHWALHTPLALDAMKQGKHVCDEVPTA